MKVSIKRSETEARLYEIEARPGESVLNVLERIYETHDATLAFAASCRVGKCGVCKMVINGRHSFACTEQADGDLVIEPSPKGKWIRDLVTVDEETGAATVCGDAFLQVIGE